MQSILSSVINHIIIIILTSRHILWDNHFSPHKTDIQVDRQTDIKLTDREILVRRPYKTNIQNLILFWK